MCLRLLRQRVIKELVAELVEATMCGIFVFILITQSSRRFCWNDCVFEFPKEHQRCSRKHTDFNAIEIMCLRLRSGTEMRIENGLRQAQAPSNKRIGGWACRSHYVWNICVCFNNTKSTEILWNDTVFEFPKEHQRCSMEHTDFNAIEIMCLRQAQAPRWELRMCLRQAQATGWEVRMCLRLRSGNV